MIALSPEVRTAILMREKQLDQGRTDYDPGYSDIRQYLLPWHGRNLNGCEKDEDTDGKLKSHKILDGTATRALGVTAAGMQAGINSPARPWFKLGYADKDLSQYKPVRSWLDQTEMIIRNIYQRSNIYNMLHHSYLELPSFGTAAAGIVPNFETVIRSRPFTVGEYWLGINAEGIVDTFMRKFRLTAKQMVEQFGLENLSDAAKSAYENKQTETQFQIIHFIEPNDDRINIPFIKGKPYRSIYHEKAFSEGRTLSVKGSEVFPIIAPRWQTVGMSVYGFGLGHMTLNDIKGLQKEKEKQLVAMDKLVDPPMVGPTSLEDQVVSTIPGGITYDDSLNQNVGLRPLYQVQPDINAIVMGIQDTRNAIRQGLFTDLFTMIANSVDQRKTAFEVAAMKEEKLMVLGPVLDSVHNEGHRPMLDIVFHYANKAGMIPEPPEEIAGLPLQVEFISILAQAQKMVATTSIEQVAGFVGNLSAVFPEARHKFNATQAVDEYADAVGVSAKVINSDEEVAKMQQAEQQQQQMQQALEASAATAQQAKVLSETDTGGNNALTALTGAMQR